MGLINKHLLVPVKKRSFLKFSAGSHAQAATASRTWSRVSRDWLHFFYVGWVEIIWHPSGAFIKILWTVVVTSDLKVTFHNSTSKTAGSAERVRERPTQGCSWHGPGCSPARRVSVALSRLHALARCALREPVQQLLFLASRVATTWCCGSWTR